LIEFSEIKIEKVVVIPSPGASNTLWLVAETNSGDLVLDQHVTDLTYENEFTIGASVERFFIYSEDSVTAISFAAVLFLAECDCSVTKFGNYDLT
jgi:hypothetical protein